MGYKVKDVFSMGLTMSLDWPISKLLLLERLRLKVTDLLVNERHYGTAGGVILDMSFITNIHGAISLDKWELVSMVTCI